VRGACVAEPVLFACGAGDLVACQSGSNLDGTDLAGNSPGCGQCVVAWRENGEVSPSHLGRDGKPRSRRHNGVSVFRAHALAEVDNGEAFESIIGTARSCILAG